MLVSSMLWLSTRGSEISVCRNMAQLETGKKKTFDHSARNLPVNQ